MQIIPQEERILVEYIEHDSAIALPDNIEEPDFAIWRVLAVGPGRLMQNGTMYKPPIEVGDEIVFLPRGAVKLHTAMYDGRKLAIVEYAAVLCVVKDRPAPKHTSKIVVPVRSGPVHA